jgi:hypothetical protein
MRPVSLSMLLSCASVVEGAPKARRKVEAMNIRSMISPSERGIGEEPPALRYNDRLPMQFQAGARA